MKTYTRWEKVPPTLKTKTQWGRLGYKLKTGITVPRGSFYSHYYETTYGLYSEKQVEVQRRICKPEDILLTERTFGRDIIAQALYVINKRAKLAPTKSKEYYLLKEKVLSFVRPDIEEIHVVSYETSKRQYIIRSHYYGWDDDVGEDVLNDTAYYSDLEHALQDEKGRPYLDRGIETKTDHYYYVEFGGYGFHSPISECKYDQLKKKGLVEKELGHEPLITPRTYTKIMPVRKAHKLLTEYCKRNEEQRHKKNSAMVICE